MSAPHKGRQLPGGIHPEERKAQSLRRPIRRAPLPPRLLIPVSQPGYGPMDILVAEGERVLKGQPLARGRGSFALAVHASSSGIVRAVGDASVPNAAGLPEPCVAIDTDGRDEWKSHAGIPEYRTCAPDELLGRIRDAGIAGLGGAGFPAHVKLGSGGIRSLIINACECEPFITADDALMREHADEVVEGILILRRLLGPERCLIGIEDNKPEAHAALQRALEDAGAAADIGLHVVPSRYPSGAERQLVWLLTGTAIPADQLPSSRGILVQNVATCRAAARAIVRGEPLISRVTTLTGAALADPGNFEVLIGTPIDFLLDGRGLRRDRLSRLIMGGSLMGIELPALQLPVTAGANCLIATTEEELPRPPPAQPCIRCGLCMEACPVSLLPQQLYWFARSREHDKARRHRLFDCIECGACAWACPSHIPLVQYYRAAKAAIREEDAGHRRAEHSRERFEFHQARLEREDAREEQRRRERAALAQARAQQDGAARDAIAAALARVKAKKARQAGGNEE